MERAKEAASGKGGSGSRLLRPGSEHGVAEPRSGAPEVTAACSIDDGVGGRRRLRGRRPTSASVTAAGWTARGLVLFSLRSVDGKVGWQATLGFSGIEVHAGGGGPWRKLFPSSVDDGDASGHRSLPCKRPSICPLSLHDVFYLDLKP
jgi:hypothetical protein